MPRIKIYNIDWQLEKQILKQFFKKHLNQNPQVILKKVILFY